MMENLNLIRSIAWSFNKTTGLPFQELFGEACLAYCEAMKTFNPEKGKESTYLTKVMINHLNTYLAEEKRQREIKANFAPEINTCFISNPFSEFLSCMPKKVQSFVKVVMDNIDEIPDELSPSHARTTLRKVLQTQGWKPYHVEQNFKQLKIYLQNN